MARADHGRGAVDSRHDPLPTREIYAGLFLVALATLTYEILLTRIFSVTLYYHFAFVAISVAMFGMTVGAVLIYQLPGYFSPGRTRRHLAVSALLFAVTSVACFLLHVTIPFLSAGATMGLGALVPTYILAAIPFVFSGISICLALTRFPGHVGRLYSADLAGAALGCVALIFTLKVTDGPTAVVVVAMLGGAGATFFAAVSGSRGLKIASLACTTLLALSAFANTYYLGVGAPLLRLFHVRGETESLALFERWNSFSRVTVRGLKPAEREPFAWGLSPLYPRGRKVREMDLRIDSAAGTRLTAYNGDPNSVLHLKFDIVNLAHFVRRDADVLVIGAGGGRDILSAMLFRQKSIVGVEINENIIRAVNDRFGDFTGHLDRDPRVTFVNDEARSYITRQTRKFDIIQISLIDTWAATAAGAFVLSENSLYTVEAWKAFLEHLTPNGILTITRWYSGVQPSEVYRVTSLASAALKEIGVRDPRSHIVIARRMRLVPATEAPDGVGTILVSPGEFSEKDRKTIDTALRQMGFQMAFSPWYSIDEVFPKLASEADPGPFLETYPLDISAPTDDRPFFFHMLRFKDVLNRDLKETWEQGANMIQLKAVTVLASLLGVVVLLTAVCIILPLLLATRREAREGSLPLFLYFSGIGMGFMLVEVSQMQRLVVFLGHPTYALSVVLFALLLSSGLGSFAAERLHAVSPGRGPVTAFLGLLAALVLFGLVTPRVAHSFMSSATPVRILIATVILFGIGLFMGMPFPFGMKLAGVRSAGLTPWLWGVNGATSVCASVLAVVIALGAGISASFWVGFACYALAFLALLWESRRLVPRSQDPSPGVAP